MDTQIIVIFCLSDDMLKSLHHYEDAQRTMSDAEVMTAALVAVLYFKGNFLMACRFLYEYGVILHILPDTLIVISKERIGGIYASGSKERIKGSIQVRRARLCRVCRCYESMQRI